VRPRAEQDERGTRYSLSLGTAAFLLVALTLLLVLGVIPQRYVLSPGFRESAMSLPSPTTPFAPLSAVPVAATLLPEAPDVIPPGPAQAFWAEVLPLLEARRYAAAISVFEGYIGENPDDLDARRELGVTLLAAGRAQEGAAVLHDVLDEAPDPVLRLDVARTLRSLGLVTEASREYAALAEARPDDEALAVEWAQMHAWAQEYDAAAEILTSALARRPDSAELRLELARVYYAEPGHLTDAIAVLAGLDDRELREAGAEGLFSEMVASLYVVPEVVPHPTAASSLDLAAAARVAGDFERARRLLEDALASDPGDRALWLAYANLLEYELADPEGARTALLEAERIGPSDAAIQLRLAQLDLWTGRGDEARERLEALLAALDAGAVGSAPVRRADVHALLGDIHRWRGDRVRAAESYERALAANPYQQRALDGLAALEEDVDRQLADIEAPRIGGLAESLADTDDFARVDAGGEWADVTGDDWVWGGTVGQRWLEGYDLAGADASRNGPFVNLELARWWRWGTLRTAVEVGAEEVTSAWEARLAASVRYRAAQDSDTEVRYEHGPAHPLANTLQSALAGVVQDRLTLAHARPLDERWSLSAVAEAASLRTGSADLVTGPDATTRLQLAVSAGRATGRSLTLGLTGGVLAFTEAAPLTSSAGSERPLFWDPNWSISATPFARLDHELSPSWALTGRVAAGLALMDERRTAGGSPSVVPQTALEAGVRHDGRRLRTSLDLFYYQGQFDGYRSYGARVTVSARNLALLGDGP